MTLDQFLAIYCPGSPAPFHIPDLPLAEGEQPAGVIYRGSLRRVSIVADDCCDGFALGGKLPDGFEDIGEFASSPYRLVWKNDQLMAIVTYCEGDIDVTIDRTAAAYAARIQAAHAFYAKR